jgi:S1-C subfamily serine protease
MLKGSKKSWPTQRATITIIRNGRELQLPIKVGRPPLPKHDNAFTSASGPTARDKWGLQLRDLDPKIAAQLHLKSDRGLIVVFVQPGSRAEATGLHPGDVIIALQSAHRLDGGLRDRNNASSKISCCSCDNGQTPICSSPFFENMN